MSAVPSLIQPAKQRREYMGIRIFDTDPEAAAKSRSKATFDDGTIGRIHSGKQVPGDKPGQMVPVALDHWEFSTGDADVSNALAELFHAPVVDTGGAEENHLRVEDTGTDTLQIILAGPHALTSDMKLWSNNNLVHHCDGVTYLSGQDLRGNDLTGAPCDCPELFADRKAAAKAGRGPKPDIKIVFQLADDPSLGSFAFKTGSFTMAEDLWKYEDALARINGPAVAALRLELVAYTTKKGRDVSYFKPVLENLRSYDDANAE